MPSTPLFSIRQLDIILISGSMMGIYLVGLGIGEQIQLNKIHISMPFFVVSFISFLYFITIRTLYYSEVKAK